MQKQCGVRRRLIKAARAVVEQRIAAFSPPYGTGFPREGYLGGYADALDDVLLLLDGTLPNRRDFWPRK